MRTSEAHRYARFSAAAAMAITLIAGSYFARRYLQARRAARNAPPPVPVEVQKASEGFSYSKQDGDRTVFTIRASRATQFKEDNRATLDEVWVTIYGATGARADNIRTHSCDYNQTSGDVVCSGDVQMDFQSAADAQRGQSGATSAASPPRIIHAETRGLSFNRDSGDAWSDQPVTLKFPGGEGSAVGVKYHSKDGLIELLHDVKFRLQPSVTMKPASGAAPQAAQANETPVVLSGSSLQYQRESGLVFLHGPVTAIETPPGLQKELHAAELSIELDTRMRARRMNAAGDAKAPAQLRSNGPKGEQILTADSFLADYAPAGWLENFRADGHVQSSMKDSSGRAVFSAGILEAKMAPELNAPAHAQAIGGVKIDSDRSGTQRHFESTELNVDFVNIAPKITGGHATTYVSHAETPSTALLSWQDPAATQRPQGAASAAGNTATDHASRMALSGKRFEMAFDEQSRLRQLQIKSAAKIDRTDASGAQQTSTSDDLSASLDEAGIWSQLIQNGHVKMHDADRAGQADHSHVDHATNTLALTGAAHVSDSDSRTSADTITINQTSSELHADGHVITTYSGSGTAATPAPSASYKPTSAANSTSTQQESSSHAANPSHATADHLVANSKTGKALYSGHARLWQGDATIEADSIELDRDAKQANAIGNVHAIFVTQASSGTSSAQSIGAPATNPSSKASRSPISTSNVETKSSQPTLWRVRAPRMTYSDLNLQAHLEGGFTAESQQLSIAGATGDLYFTRSQPRAQSSASAGTANQSSSATSLDHATASEHVTVRQGDRHGAAELGQYSAPAGTFTLSGGHPTFTDASGNTTSGTKLTFNTTDDTILVQSEESSRPQPHHQVEK
jgi:lipopolysaccharide export system protein LptA